MKIIRWDEEKNGWLKRTRGVCFEQVAVRFEQRMILDIVDNPNWEKYPLQKIAVVEIEGYAYLVPYEQINDEIVLRTIIPSRRATREYLRGEHEKDQS
jgi:uncharacterized DUF497 family protein